MSYLPDDPNVRHLIEMLPDRAALVDERGVIRGVNELLARWSGYTRDELVGRAVEVLIPARSDGANVTDSFEIARSPSERSPGAHFECVLSCRDGTERLVDVALARLEVESVTWLVATVRERIAEHSTEVTRSDDEVRFRLAFEVNTTPMTFADADDRIIDANDAYCQMVGRTRDEIRGIDASHFCVAEDIGIGETNHLRFRHGETDRVHFVVHCECTNGSVIVVEVSKAVARDASGTFVCFVSSLRDVTEERAFTAQLSHRALHDTLTGLANRALFEDRFALARARVLRQGGLGVVSLFDLDNFKGVNDTHGHVVGDQLLVAIAHRLGQVTRSSDTLCRFGGDEFLFLGEGLTSPLEAELVASRLLGVFAEPFLIGGTLLDQRASVGVVVWDATSTDTTELIREADAALYEAKRAGKGRHVILSSIARP